MLMRRFLPQMARGFTLNSSYVSFSTTPCCAESKEKKSRFVRDRQWGKLDADHLRGDVLLKLPEGDSLPPLYGYDPEVRVTIEDLYDARVHFGHKIGTLNDNMKWALYGERLGVCIFDLNITQQYLLRALGFLMHVAYNGGVILFVTTNRAHMVKLERTAEELGQYSNTRKWVEGQFFNASRFYGAPIRYPDAVVFTTVLTSTMEPHPAISEITRMGIPCVGVVDSNADPGFMSYVIPGNDDSMLSFNYYMELFKVVIQFGTDLAKRHNEDEKRKVQQKKQIPGQYRIGQRR
ncbi:ribosomal protein s2 domain-containing protein [Ditylenchus destructor]|uniref:Ribosomal protein s2 domain-containing protein n=1 Tax=Ditylenchus destructor TaxID=166010 RepID=A0AAD4NDH1_9BILA|nr:ribosomal protein s2 domain-containing protein [Ditylenchus destructor]